MNKNFLKDVKVGEISLEEFVQEKQLSDYNGSGKQMALADLVRFKSHLDCMNILYESGGIDFIINYIKGVVIPITDTRIDLHDLDTMYELLAPIANQYHPASEDVQEEFFNNFQDIANVIRKRTANVKVDCHVKKENGVEEFRQIPRVKIVEVIKTILGACEEHKATIK